MAALVHRVPGKWVGHAVLSETFRHPAVLAKAATVLDHATGGRFILGLGAGWHEGEHEPFGIPTAADAGAVRPVRVRGGRAPALLWSEAASAPPGVTRPDPFYPLDRRDERPAAADARRPAALARRPEATRHRAGRGAGRRLGPAGRRRPPAPSPGYFSREARRDPGRARGRSGATRRRFEIVAQVPTGTTAEDRARAVEQAREAVERGATHVILGMPPAAGSGRRRRRRARGRDPAPRGDRVTWSHPAARRDATADLASDRRRSSNATTPDEPTSVEDMRWSDATYPGGARFLAEEDGRAVGAATVGRIFMYAPEYAALWGTVDVLPEARRRGIGTGAAPGDLVVARGGRQAGAPHLRVARRRPEAIAFLARARLRRVRARARSSGSTWRACLARDRSTSRRRPDDLARGEPDLVAGRPRGRARGVRRHPRRRRADGGRRPRGVPRPRRRPAADPARRRSWSRSSRRPIG